MLPVFMQDEKTNAFLREAIKATPKGTKVYLVGGAARNAVYHRLTGKTFPQRDYDLVVIGNLDRYISNLRKAGFTYGRIRRKDHITLKKKRVPKPKDWFRDNVFLDFDRRQHKSIRASLKENAAFTINGFAIPLKAITSENWHKRLIALPGAMADLKAKRLRVNNVTHPANLYAAIRFMSLGFKRPNKKEVELLIEKFATMERWRFERNVRKVYGYVGGRKTALALAKKLGLGDIYKYRCVEKLKDIYTR